MQTFSHMDHDKYPHSPRIISLKSLSSLFNSSALAKSKISQQTKGGKKGREGLLQNTELGIHPVCCNSSVRI